MSVKQLKARKVENILRQQYGLHFFIFSKDDFDSGKIFNVTKSFTNYDEDRWDYIVYKGKSIPGNDYLATILNQLCKDGHLKTGNYEIRIE